MSNKKLHNLLVKQFEKYPGSKSDDIQLSLNPIIEEQTDLLPQTKAKLRAKCFNYLSLQFRKKRSSVKSQIENIVIPEKIKDSPTQFCLDKFLAGSTKEWVTKILSKSSDKNSKKGNVNSKNNKNNNNKNNNNKNNNQMNENNEDSDNYQLETLLVPVNVKSIPNLVEKKIKGYRRIT